MLCTLTCIALFAWLQDGHLPVPHLRSMKNVQELPRPTKFRRDPSGQEADRLLLTADCRLSLAGSHRLADDVRRAAPRSCRPSPVRGAEVEGHSSRLRASTVARPRLLTADARNGQAIIFCRKGIERPSESFVQPDDRAPSPP